MAGNVHIAILNIRYFGSPVMAETRTRGRW